LQGFHHFLTLWRFRAAQPKLLDSHHNQQPWLWSAMNRSKGFLLVVSSLFAFTLLAGLCGCGSVSGSTGGGGASQAVIAMAVAPDTIVQGQSTTLTWQVTNAASFSISPAVASGTLPFSGSASVSPSQTTTYTATAADSQGRTATKTITVTVVPQGS